MVRTTSGKSKKRVKCLNLSEEALFWPLPFLSRTLIAPLFMRINKVQVALALEVRIVLLMFMIL